MSQVGKILAGRYCLVEQLGKGGMGSVWRAEHLALRSPIAIKLIDLETTESYDAQVRFMREAQAAANLRSPHVVQVLDYGVDDGTPFIAMELLEGESLGTRLGRLGRLSVNETSNIVSQTARAMTRAHDAGIMHRDLKPDNIFLVGNDDEEIAKVLDFGIAKNNLALSADGFSATRTGAVLGTPYYMSPEQIQGEKNIDCRTDIWSLGVIAFECITGERPFDAETLGGLVMAICARPIVVPSTLGAVPPGFDAWFAKSVARDVNDRFTSAKEQAAVLRQICEGRTEPAGTPSTETEVHATTSSRFEITASGLGATVLSNHEEPPAIEQVVRTDEVPAEPMETLVAQQGELLDVSTDADPAEPSWRDDVSDSGMVAIPITPFHAKRIGIAVALLVCVAGGALLVRRTSRTKAHEALVVAARSAAPVSSAHAGPVGETTATSTLAAMPVDSATPVEELQLVEPEPARPGRVQAMTETAGRVTDSATRCPTCAPDDAACNQDREANKCPTPAVTDELHRPDGDALAAPSAQSGSEAAPFNRNASEHTLNVAAAQATACNNPEGLSGSATVQVTFAPNGRAIMAKMVSGDFIGTSLGRCIEVTFMRARVPAFNGAPVSVSRVVSLGPKPQ
jgi:serine/threonine protein kinase